MAVPGSTAMTMREKLTMAFEPTRLELDDQSARHAGHSGARPGGETHFHVVIVSAVFEGLSRVERQRRVNRVLAQELRGPVHALSIEARAPGEV